MTYSLSLSLSLSDLSSIEPATVTVLFVFSSRFDKIGRWPGRPAPIRQSPVSDEGFFAHELATISLHNSRPPPDPVLPLQRILHSHAVEGCKGSCSTSNLVGTDAETCPRMPSGPASVVPTAAGEGATFGHSGSALGQMAGHGHTHQHPTPGASGQRKPRSRRPTKPDLILTSRRHLFQGNPTTGAEPCPPSPSKPRPTLDACPKSCTCSVGYDL